MMTRDVRLTSTFDRLCQQFQPVPPFFTTFLDSPQQATMKRAASPPSSSVQKRVRLHTPPRASLSTWLKPGEPAPLLLSSPHLHAVSSTFTSFAMSLSPPSNVRTPEALKKYAASIVRGLDVVSLVGKELIESKDGCFQNDGGLAPGPRPKAREPDHKMWACRALVLKEGKDGTQGEEDYQVSSSQSVRRVHFVSVCRCFC